MSEDRKTTEDEQKKAENSWKKKIRDNYFLLKDCVTRK